MSSISFEAIAGKFLENLYDILSDREEIEVEISEGVMTIIAPNGHYAINLHNATKQIWYSSPISFTGKFSLKDGKFYDEKGREIEERLFSDLKTKILF
jgi:frataxin-like iron-binding protein CyaY